MEGKKLNIEFAENLAGTTCDDNSCNNWDHFDNHPSSSPVQQLLNDAAATKNDIEALISIIKSKDYQINDLKGKLSELEIKSAVYEEKENLQKDKIKYMEELIAVLKLSVQPAEKDDLQSKLKLAEVKLSENDILIQDYKTQVNNRDTTIKSLRKNVSDLNSKIKELESKKKLKNIYITMAYGPTKQMMYVPGLLPFVPTIDDRIAGPGWIVIQRRIDGSVNFQTSLESYQKGFGSPKGEFWLGLEKLHIMTTHKRHELYIHIVDYDNKAHSARYDNFVVGSLKEKYELQSLGKYTGDANDLLRLSEKKTFAVGTNNFKNGWWWHENVIPNSNLNGKYSNTKVENQEYIFWGFQKWGNKGNFIKSVQMLIKPKTD